MSGSPRTDAYLAELRAEFPGLEIIDKTEHAPSQAIDRALRLLTFGGQSAYVSRYTTVLGRRVYVPAGWDARSDDSRYITLRHEAVHLRQFRRFTWPGMVLIYGVLVLPMGLAAGRTFIEWEAYRETLRATAEVYGIEAARDPQLHAQIIAQFVGPAYAWMWPFPGAIRRWIDRALNDIEAELSSEVTS